MKYLIRAIVIIIILVAIVIGTQVYGYSSLKTDFSASDVSPKLNTSTESVVTGLLSVFQGNLLGAVSSFVQGLQVDGTLTLKNGSFLPLYLPSMQHKIEINGTQTQNAISTSAMWIGPGGSKIEPFSILIDKADLPTMALNILASGGNIDISVESSAVLAGFTITKTSQKQANLTNSLSSYTSSSSGSNQSTSSEPSVTSYGFSPNSTLLGNSVSASLTISGGGTGTYTLRLIKDIDFGTDQVINSYSISHNGSTTSESYSFTPQSSGSYHLDLQFDSSTIWSQPNDVSRLKVSSPTPQPTQSFSVTSYGFSPNSTLLGNSVTASVTISGGGAGTYTLRLIKDIDFGTDQVINSYSISYNGSTTSKSYSFTPQSSGSYHLDLQFDSSTIWSQPNDASRLKISSPTTQATQAFSVTSYGFSPNSTTLGNTVAFSITVSGGSSGAYTLNLLKDTSLGSDQLLNSYTISHDGTTTNKSYSFVPPSVGSYHLNISYNGSTLWSQPNDSSRLTISTPMPNVKITNVDIPVIVTVGPTYNYNVNLTNNGSAQAIVNLKIDSSLTGNVSNTSVTIPANSNLIVPITTSFTTAGVRTVTYSVLYNGQIIDSMTKSVQANNAVSFSVTSYGFTPNPTTLGHAVTFSISMSGGTAGTYTLRLIKDVNFGADQLITSYTISYDGTNTSKSYSFTPASSGSYHLDLQFNSSAIWSQPNDSSRLKVN